MARFYAFVKEQESITFPEKPLDPGGRPATEKEEGVRYKQIDIQELLFLLNSDKGEEWAISNFKLKLIKYYRSMEAWKEATDKLE